MIFILQRFEFADVAACSKSGRVMDLDFHGMKRKRLQALCKKHGIPANLKNKEMADRLSSIFKVLIIIFIPFSLSMNVFVVVVVVGFGVVIRSELEFCPKNKI